MVFDFEDRDLVFFKEQRFIFDPDYDYSVEEANAFFEALVDIRIRILPGIVLINKETV